MTEEVSKIDVSVVEDEHGIFKVVYRGKSYGYFPNRLGAEEWKKNFLEEILAQQ